FPENTPENEYCNGSEQDQCDYGGQDQYGPNDNADENYFENDEQRYYGEQMHCSNEMNMALQGSAENSCNANQGENVPIYSQVPFQPEPSRMDLFQLMTNVDQKVTGMDQRVSKMEQKRSQSQNQNFRLSYAEGNIPMQSSSKLHSTSSQPQTAPEMQGKHPATSDRMENRQQNQHQSRKMRQDFCEDASHSNRPHKSSLVSENPTPPSSQPDFRLSYEGGNRPTKQPDENCPKCASIQDQHL
ncbi:MAG: hypothetical protein GY820_18380, partial [Gammaproteobacteria bacterium]|nr:hypothetical protein [Gammaproteobacteria bacterium]